MKDYKTDIYKDKKGEFRWRRLASDGKIDAESSRGFSTKTSCLKNEGNAFVVGKEAAVKINKVEGLTMSGKMKKMFEEFRDKGENPSSRRSAIKQTYGSAKG
jgi:uncharacterized protein YegP (UPF0339 family)